MENWRKDARREPIIVDLEALAEGIAHRRKVGDMIQQPIA